AVQLSYRQRGVLEAADDCPVRGRGAQLYSATHAESQHGRLGSRGYQSHARGGPGGAGRSTNSSAGSVLSRGRQPAVRGGGERGSDGGQRMAAGRISPLLLI